MAEAFRIEVPIRVDDQTDPGVSRAKEKLNGFDKAAQKTQERLNQMNRTKYQVVLSALDKASSIIGSVSTRARSIAGKTFSFTMKVVDMATAPLRAVWNFATSIQGAILGATGAFAGIYKPMELAGNYEQLQIAFKTMLGSAEKAKSFLNDVTNFANETPFEFPELAESSKLLLSFGFESERILDIMRTIGDTSSGLSAGAAGIDRITRALGQMQAKGRLQTEELLQLQELGVPANQILQEELGLTREQIANIGNESIDAAKAIDALLRGMDKRYGGLMGEQARSALGLISTIKDTLFSKLLRPWGEGLWGGVKPGLSKITTWLEENQETVTEWGEAWKEAGDSISKWVMSKVENLRDSIQKMTNSQEWKDAKNFGSKMKIAWNTIIAEPFMEWWNSTGKAWLADKASKIGEGIGTALKIGILGLLGVDTRGAMTDGASIGASFAEGFVNGFDGAKVAEAIKEATKGIFKDASTLLPGGKESSSTSWLSAILLTFLGVKGAKGIGSLFKGGKGIYNFGKGIFKGAKAADTATDAVKAAGMAAGAADDATNIAKATANLKDVAGSFRSAANASKEAEKAVKTAETLKASKQADLEGTARLLKELKKEAAKYGDDIPKGLSGKIKSADKAVIKGRIDVKKAASHLDDMVNMRNFKALEYANAREGFTIAKDVANAAKAADAVGDIGSKTGIFSKIAGWLGKNGDDALKAGSKVAGKGAKGIPVLGALIGLATSGAIVASAAPKDRGKEAAGEVGSWLGAIGAGAGAGALVGTLGGGPIGTAIGATVGGIGGAIGGEAFTEWLYDQKDAIGDFFTKTLPKGWDTLWSGVGNFFSEQLPYGIGYAGGKIQIFFTEGLPSFIGNLLEGVGNFVTQTIPTAAASAVTGITTFFTSTLPSFFTDLLNGVGSFVTQAIPAAAKNIGGGIKTFFTESVPGFFKGLWDKIGGGIAEGYSAATGSTQKHAYGGIMTKPHMGIVAEDGAEGIIPLSPSKRRRGIDLWQRTGELLGVRPYEEGGIVGDTSVAVSAGGSGRRGEGGNLTVNNQIKPDITFNISTGADANEVVAAVRNKVDEIAEILTDKVADKTTEKLKKVYANMPRKAFAH